MDKCSFCFSRFFWKTENFPAELSITPAKGYISPGMEVPLDVTFAPVELSSDSRYENLCCSVEGSSSPLTLTVTASCVTASTNKEVRLEHPLYSAAIGYTSFMKGLRRLDFNFGKLKNFFFSMLDEF